MRAGREAVDELYEAQRAPRRGAARRRAAEVVRAAIEPAVAVYERHGPLLRAIAEAAAGDEQVAAGHAAMRERFDDARRAGAARRGPATTAPPADLAETARALNLHERELPDSTRSAASRACRAETAVQTLTEIWDAVIHRGRAPASPPRRKDEPMDVFRTPDERFEDLPGYPYEPHYVEVDGLRLHHLDEGSGLDRRSASTASRAGATSTGTCSTGWSRAATASCAPTSSASAAPTSRPTRAGTRTTATSRRSTATSTRSTSRT